MSLPTAQDFICEQGKGGVPIGLSLLQVQFPASKQ